MNLNKIPCFNCGNFGELCIERVIDPEESATLEVQVSSTEVSVEVEPLHFEAHYTLMCLHCDANTAITSDNDISTLEETPEFSFDSLWDAFEDFAKQREVRIRRLAELRKEEQKKNDAANLGDMPTDEQHALEESKKDAFEGLGRTH